MRFLCLVLVVLVLGAGGCSSKVRALKSQQSKSGLQTATSPVAPSGPSGPVARTAPAVKGPIPQAGPAPLPAAPAPAVQQEQQSSAPAPPPRTEKSWPVEGNGLTIEDARSDAWRRADGELHAYLREHYPDLERPLTAAYLTRSGILRVVRDDHDTAHDTYGAWVQVDVSPERLAELSDLARKDRMGPRQRVALLVLFELCSVLVVGWIYLRLENATRGYSTGLLRLAAATVLALALAVGAMVVLW